MKLITLEDLMCPLCRDDVRDGSEGWTHADSSELCATLDGTPAEPVER